MRSCPLVLVLLLAACDSSRHLPVRLEDPADRAPDPAVSVDGGSRAELPGHSPSWSEVRFASEPADNFFLQAVATSGSRVLLAATTVRVLNASNANIDEQFGVHVFAWDGLALTELGGGWTLAVNEPAVTPTVGFDASGAPLVAWGEARRLHLYRWADGGWTELATPAANRQVWCSLLVTGAGRVVLAWRGGQRGDEALTLSELDAASGTFQSIAAPIVPGAGHTFWSCPSVALAGARTFVAWDENYEDGNSTITTGSRIHVAEARNGGFALISPPLGMEGPTDNGEYCRLNWYPKLMADSAGDATVAWKSCEGIHALRIAPGDRPGQVATIASDEGNPFPLRMLVASRGSPLLISRTDDSPPVSFALRRDAEGTWTRLPLGTNAPFYGGSGMEIADLDDSGALVILAGRDLLRRMPLPDSAGP